ncbi:hypothetical protein BOTBODRAFT_30941 [Botryobasidium botryosum FD-172 SS1]|uniref:F-box domain-containing protein n=1 Tax=Botryobasidium botryosum (strain FD-172 SS1) TaxID=930990 RepID=A0A067MNC2_BOTB1|nr:hypothetical protein BOTBODRAFT_30941 [Botryobasidium botryosum FD-172 SS1]
MANPLPELPFDVLTHIFEHILDERILQICAFVNRAFNAAATPFLWAHITSANTRYLTLLRRKELSVHVLDASEEFRPIPLREGYGFDTDQAWFECLAMCKNLRTYAWNSPHARFENALPILKRCPKLQCVVLLTQQSVSSALDPLICLSGLRKLRLYHRHWYTLSTFKYWMKLLSDQLEDLALEIQFPLGYSLSEALHPLRKLRRFVLSRACSTPSEMLSLVSHFYYLETLEIAYEHPLAPRDEIFFPCNLPSLRRLVITQYNDIKSKQDHKLLFAFVDALTAGSYPEALLIFSPETLPGRRADNFVTHLSKKHKSTMRTLFLENMYVGYKTIQKLHVYFPNLEGFSISVGTSVFAHMGILIAPSVNLRVLYLHVPPTKGQVEPRFEYEEALALMLQGPPKLRRIQVNDNVWVGKWETRPLAEGGVAVYLGVHREP